ncbi:MAG: aminotransferase class III-fold pyridoxal phosphate-dependent enzyme [Acidimicrobiia bacterium]
MTYATEGPALSGPSSIDRTDAMDTVNRLTLTEPIGAGVVRVMVTQLDIALLALEGLNPDVHVARKAMKRTRGLLRLVRDSIGEAAYRTENDALRDAARRLAPARDATATIETFDGLLAAHPGALGIAEENAIREALTIEERNQQALLTVDPNLLPAVIGALTETRQRVIAIPASPATRPGPWDFDAIEDGLRRTYRRCRRGLAAVVDDPSEEAFHRWRKAVKYLRHQMEALVAYSPDSLGDLVERLDVLGETLGSAQDLAVLSDTLTEVGDEWPAKIDLLVAHLADESARLHDAAIRVGSAIFVDRPRVFVVAIRDAFDKPEHIELASDHYGLVVQAKPLPSEVDDLARLDTRNGDTYVMRISPPGTDVATLRLIAEAMAATADGGVPAPHTVATTSGDDHVNLADGRVVRLHTWLPDGTHGSAGMSASVARSIGMTAGSLVNALARIPQPSAPRPDRHWDLTHASTTIADRLPHVATESARSLLEEVLERIERVPFSDLPRQVIHNDLNPENLLVVDDAVVGVIDFGDVAWTVRIGELAVACAYAMLEQDDPVNVGTAIAAAYGQTTTVTAAEAEWLFDLILGRLAISASIAAARPNSNPHHQNTSSGVWSLLATLLAADTRWISAQFAAACVRQTPEAHPTSTKRLAADRQVLGPSLSLSYREPLHIVRGRGAYLYDAEARRFLDGVNNVAHVGHAHPAVVEAAHTQASTLNTNSRYLHPEVLKYASRIADTLPHGLDTVFLVNSGSEANELAIRIARTATGRTDLACLDDAYHGNTGQLVNVSPYKFNGPGGDGPKDGVHVLPSPDPYRSPELAGAGAGEHYRNLADESLANAQPAALIAEALLGCGGQLVPAPGVIAAAYEAVRELGGVVISDEVQTGLGRAGSTFWAFELHDVVPDIVTVGKPAGNGYPLAAVVTTSALAQAFDTGMEYFNTFGGNPVSAAVGNAVLDVIFTERLQARARILGAYLLDGLTQLSERHDAIGDVRGAGLFVGVELVTDRSSKEPDADLATAVVEFAKSSGVLLSTDGPHHNVIKIKPPLVLGPDDCKRIVATVDAALGSVDRS